MNPTLKNEISPTPLATVDIDWDCTNLSLYLVSAMEENKRWRLGITSYEEQYCGEIAQALFSTHPVYSSAYRQDDSAFATAVKHRLRDLMPSEISTTSQAPSETSYWKDIRLKLRMHSCPLAAPKLIHTDTSRHVQHPTAPARWDPTIPHDLQCLIAHLAAFDESGNLDVTAASSLRLVNSYWAKTLEPVLFYKVFLHEFTDLAAFDEAKQHGCLRRTKAVVIRDSLTKKEISSTSFSNATEFTNVPRFPLEHVEVDLYRIMERVNARYPTTPIVRHSPHHEAVIAVTALVINRWYARSVSVTQFPSSPTLEFDPAPFSFGFLPVHCPTLEHLTISADWLLHTNWGDRLQSPSWPTTIRSARHLPLISDPEVESIADTRGVQIVHLNHSSIAILAGVAALHNRNIGDERHLTRLTGWDQDLDSLSEDARDFIDGELAEQDALDCGELAQKSGLWDPDNRVRWVRKGEVTEFD